MAMAVIQSYLSFLFFSIAVGVVSLAAVLLVARRWPWCNCKVCKAYLSSSWTADFDNLCDWYAHLLRRSPTATIHIHVLNNIVTANPDNVEHMLKTRFDNFPKGKPFSALLGDFLGQGIFNVDGEHWHFQRKMASLELGSVSVRSYAFEIVTAEVRNRLIPLVASFSDDGRRDGAIVDLQDVFRRFALDSICKISFALDPGCLELSLPISEFATAFDDASRLSALRATSTTPIVWKLKRLLNIGSERRLKYAIGLVHTLAEEVIRQRRKLGSHSGHDLLSRFMSSFDNDDDESYLRDIIISFLLAGRDTVASALTSFFFLASKHQGVVAAMREEIARVMKERGHVNGDEEKAAMASYEELKEMHYVHAALYESMRLFPPVQFDSKFCADDDVLPDGTFVTKDTRVTYHPYAMGRMENIWGADAGEFRPERWLRMGTFTPESPFKYPVFQGGLRVCLGKELALMEMKTVIVALLPQFDIEVLEKERAEPRFVPGLTATVAGGSPARVHWLRSGNQ